jgi:hypothetical protein
MRLLKLLSLLFILTLTTVALKCDPVEPTETQEEKDKKNIIISKGWQTTSVTPSTLPNASNYNEVVLVFSISTSGAKTYTQTFPSGTYNVKNTPAALASGTWDYTLNSTTKGIESITFDSGSNLRTISNIVISGTNLSFDFTGEGQKVTETPTVTYIMSPKN